MPNNMKVVRREKALFVHPCRVSFSFSRIIHQIHEHQVPFHQSSSIIPTMFKHEHKFISSIGAPFALLVV